MKNWLRSKSKGDDREPELTVDELLALGRGLEARILLEERLRSKPRDRRAQVKLGDVLLALERPSEALDMYESAAQSYAGDGFHDKAKALLQKMLKIAPQHEKAILGLEQLDRAKERERRRQIVVRHLRKVHQDDQDSLDAFRINQLWKNLSRSRVLEALDTSNLGRLFEQFRLRRLAPQDEIASRGDQLEELFLVAHGRVEVLQKRADGPPVVLRGYEPGDVFGESALLERRPWTAWHRAAGPTHLLCLDREGLAALLPGLRDPRSFLDALRIQRHDASLAAMVRTAGETGGA
ncbi:MAG: cyclic nucleotide-binding domain-containing protein [Acidobacteriota bacterium]|nr:cyclic nucleotide-binding domain-containing protein [Acidobacteriota bacterium]MDH3524877.1 cyclic nucleotide-binding domain-containing protein [Acidobacteriota bacterium]